MRAGNKGWERHCKSVSDDRKSFALFNETQTYISNRNVRTEIPHVKAPIYVFRQWHRHRMASLNEYSGRYSEMIDDCERTSEWRLQSTSNKQGSKDGKLEWPEDTSKLNIFPILEDVIKDSYSPESYLSYRESYLQELLREGYEERLKFGIAKEQARKDLSVSNYSEMIWKSDLHNLLHFLSLRMDSHAQKEIRDYANIIGNEIVAALFPQTWEAFQDYRFQAITLSRLDIEMINNINNYYPGHSINPPEPYYIECGKNFGWLDKNGKPSRAMREREEFEVKATKLGIGVPWL